MKRMKRIAGCLLAMAMLLTCAPFAPLTAEAVTTAGSCGADGNNLTWKLDNDGVLTISGTGRMKEYKYYSDYPWYHYRASVNSVMVNEGVTSIHDNAFYGSSLTSISIPSSVEYIGDGVFGECGSLVGITIATDNQWYSSEDGVLFDKEKSTLICCPAGISGSYTIPDSVEYIGDSAFDRCSGLTEVIIGKGVSYIGDYAFWMCTKISSVDIPNSVDHIGDCAFDGCSGLSEVIIGKGVSYIGYSVFGGCEKLKSVSIPDSNSLAYVGWCAFDDTAWYSAQPEGPVYVGKCLYSYKGAENCPRNIKIREGTLSISPLAFSDCENLYSIEMPDSVVCIGFEAFDYCYDLTNIKFSKNIIYIEEMAFDDTAWYDAQSNGLIYVGKTAYKYKGTCPEEIKIKEGTLSISDRAFFVCEDLVRVSIPKSVIIIGSCAFSDCVCLEEINIPNSVKYIRDYAFSTCESMKSVRIPESVISIGDGAFDECSSLTKIHFDGSAPAGGYAVLGGVTATAYYHPDETWTKEIMQEYGGNITWISLASGGEVGDVPSDFTGDGLVTDEDVIYLLWYTVFPEDYPLNQSGDMDGDGLVTDADVIYLLWHTVFPEDYPIN